MPAGIAPDVAHAIQLSLAPVFLLTGIAGLLNVMAARLGRIIDRGRRLKEQPLPAPMGDDPLIQLELHSLEHRRQLASLAITASTLSALLVCTVIAGLFLEELLGLPLRWLQGVLFTGSTLSLTVGLAFFLREVHLATHTVRTHLRPRARARPPGARVAARPSGAPGLPNAPLHLRVTEIKAFVPARDFARSRQFYQDLGFTMASEGGGVAYFHFGHASFLLQDYCQPGLAENFMMHLLVEDVAAWRQQVLASGVVDTYGVRLTELADQPWRMRDFCLWDPSGVLWRIGQNIP